MPGGSLGDIEAKAGADDVVIAAERLKQSIAKHGDSVLAVGGLLTQFGLQAWINMASSLHLMPTKGMTLPFISYGGSSLLALSLAMGMVLALTRRRAGLGDAT